MSITEKIKATEDRLTAELEELRRLRPVELTDGLRRFSARFTSFARSRWDPSSPAYGKTPRSMEEIVALEKPGYAREDFALQAGAWTMASRMRAPAGEAVDGKYMESAEQSEKKRHEPEDRAEFTQRVKSAARLYGAAMVGVTRVDPLWVYAGDGEERPIELPSGVRTAVVLAVEMDYKMIRSSPSATASAATGDGYSRMAFVAACTARFLEALGWQALPCGNDTALSIPLAIDAGLGELGRNGLLITREFGPRVRLCKVFTDAPLVADTPVTFGVKEFCEVCMRCADECPAASISTDEPTWEGPTPSNNPGALKWYVNVDTCLAFWRSNGTGCANCIRSCPFNKPRRRFHDLVRFFIRAQSRYLDRVLVWADGLAGYGHRRDPERFWPSTVRRFDRLTVLSPPAGGSKGKLRPPRACRGVETHSRLSERIAEVDTDIRVLEVEPFFQEIFGRLQLLFGRKMQAGGAPKPLPITLLSVRVLAENRAAQAAEGWGSILLSTNWAFPSDVVAQETRDEAMREVARRYARRIAEWREFAHPLVIAMDSKSELLGIGDQVAGEMALGEPMPALASLNAGSPIDCALHDAFGKAGGFPTYAGYGKEHCSFDLSRWLGSEYRGAYLSSFLAPEFAPTVPLFHLVGGGDKLTQAERDDTDPQDGLPVSLDEWIGRDGVYCFKVKLKGTDLDWDVARVVAVSRVVEEELAKQGRGTYFLSVDSNEMCPDPEYVVEMLEQIRAEAPRAYDALLYVEQPTERDLTAHRFDLSEVSARKPVLADEGISSLEDIDVARELGWSGIALKTCKGFSSALLSVAKARREGLLYSVQDLTNPGLSLLHSVGFAARIGPLKGVEANARQFIPFASGREAAVHPRLFQPTGGEVSTESLTGTGLGFRVDEMEPFEVG